MAVKLKATLWAHKADKEGLCPIAIAIRSKGKETYYNTGIKVRHDHFIDGRVVKGAENWDILDATLQRLIQDCNREILSRSMQGETITIETAKAFFNPKVAGVNFIKYAENIISDKNPKTKKRYLIELEKVKAYAGDKLNFGQITPEWLMAYYTYLTTEIKGKKEANSHNTAINAFKVIRHVFNEAKEANAIKYYPFDEWKYPQYRQPKKHYLTMEQCNKIFDKLEKNELDDPLRIVAAFFLLECFAAIRVSDWGKFSIEKMVHENEMIFTTTKTDTPVRLPIELMPSLKRILTYIEANNLKWTYTGEFANMQLKYLGKLIKYPHPLTTHVGRHSAATLYLSKGMSKEGVAQILGVTTRIVDTYAHLTSNKIKDELTRIGGF